MILYTIIFAALAGAAYYYLWVKGYRASKIADAELRGKIVFISGCDSGFGERTSLALCAKGFHVFSTCLTEQGAQKLNAAAAQIKAGGVVTTIMCDITKEEDVVRAHEVVAQACKERNVGVWAIINNAGVATLGPVEWTPLAEYYRLFDVNFFGHVRVTKLFLPLIRKSRGRVVNITSIAGDMALQSGSVYCATKHALHAFNNSLRRELEYFGCKVICVAPGWMKTPIISSGWDLTQNYWAALPPPVQAAYTPAYLELLKSRFGQRAGLAESPQLVVDVLVDSVTLKNPPPRYTVGVFALLMEYTTNLLPVIIWDLIFHRHSQDLRRRNAATK